MNSRELDEAWRLHRAGEHERAEGLYRDILRTDPSNYDALHRLAFLHGQRGRWNDAEQVMARAIALNPSAGDALFLRGAALQKLERHEEAVDCFDRALALVSAFAEVRLNRAASLYRLRRYEAAGDDYDRLLKNDADYPFARGNRLFCRLQCCDWRSLLDHLPAIERGIRSGRRIIAPFDAKALFLSPEDELACARVWAEDQHAGPTPAHPSRDRHQHFAIRVAYISADFREGPLATLMAGVFERHDAKRIETIGVSLGPDDGSPMRRRLEHAFGTFIDARARSDAEIAAQLRAMEVDVAVDLMGYTEGGRPGIFKQRPAPIQVNYLAYPGTVGGYWLDYLIADRVVVPDDQQRHYAERIVHLPCMLPRDTAIKPSDAPISRADEGLPAGAFVFACFNNSYKLNPVMFDIWMRLLRAVQPSVLWLAGGNQAARLNLAREAAARGVAPERLVFAPFRKSLEQHLARLRLADLFLDTLPYNAHTTASDALWAGVPVLTCRGATFAGRVAASLLQSLGLAELVTSSLADYEARALQLARDANALRVIRDKLEQRTVAHLFDETQFARRLETAYLTMWQRHQSNLQPEGFSVA